MLIWPKVHTHQTKCIHRNKWFTSFYTKLYPPQKFIYHRCNLLKKNKLAIKNKLPNFGGVQIAHTTPFQKMINPSYKSGHTYVLQLGLYYFWDGGGMHQQDRSGMRQGSQTNFAALSMNRACACQEHLKCRRIPLALYS